MNLFEKYRKMNIDGSLISLEYQEIDQLYFCYPINASVIGFEGCILYCFIPEYGEMVFASNPENYTNINVYPLAKNFEDFLKLIIACGSANPIEQIINMNKERFIQHLTEERKTYTDEQIKLIELLKKELNLSPMENPFEYVKELQKDFDGSRIQYSEEYYDILGLDSPYEEDTKECGFEFEPVLFEFKK